MGFNINVKIKKIKKEAIIPTYATEGAAGADLYACIEKDIKMNPGGFALIPTGIAIELPDKNWGAFIFARSGLAIKNGISLANGVGVMDSDYRGEICVGLRNFSAEDYIIKKNERIAQMVIMPVATVSFFEANTLNDTVRGEGGFGSTGK